MMSVQPEGLRDPFLQALLKRVPPDFLQDAHHWLILHGRYTCKARRPECWRCPVRDVCRFEDKSEDGEPR